MIRLWFSLLFLGHPVGPLKVQCRKHA